MRCTVVTTAIPCLAVAMVVLALLTPPAARACAGCSMPLREAISETDYGVVAVVERSSPDGSRDLRVTDVFEGSPRTHLAFGPDPRAIDLPDGTRWILFGASSHGLDARWTVAWQVLPGGRLMPPPGPPLDAPTTLAAFVRLFAAPATNTVTAPPRQLDWVGGVAVLAAAATIGAWAARRRGQSPS